MIARRVTSTLDLENLAEKVESLGRSDLNTMRGQVRPIIEYLLKLEFSPSAPRRADSRYAVAQAPREVEDHFTASMYPDVAADLEKLFGRARQDAALGLGKHGERNVAQSLPTTCAYSLDQIVSHDWYPSRPCRSPHALSAEPADPPPLKRRAPAVEVTRPGSRPWCR